MVHYGDAGSGDLGVIQVDVYRLDNRLERSFETDGGKLYDTMCGIAGRRVDSLVNFVLGDVSVLRVDLGRNGFAVLEHLS
jgi:hypothetical protein